MNDNSTPPSWRQDYRQCNHGPRVPRWGKSSGGKMWAGFMCPVKQCDPIWVNDLERIYDAWAARMMDEIHSGTVAAETVATMNAAKAARLDRK